MNAVEEERPEYEVVRSKRATADIVLERDGRIVVRVVCVRNANKGPAKVACLANGNAMRRGAAIP